MQLGEQSPPGRHRDALIDEATLQTLSESNALTALSLTCAAPPVVRVRGAVASPTNAAHTPTRHRPAFDAAGVVFAGYSHPIAASSTEIRSARARRPLFAMPSSSSPVVVAITDHRKRRGDAPGDNGSPDGHRQRASCDVDDRHDDERSGQQAPLRFDVDDQALVTTDHTTSLSSAPIEPPPTEPRSELDLAPTAAPPMTILQRHTSQRRRAATQMPTASRGRPIPVGQKSDTIFADEEDDEGPTAKASMGLGPSFPAAYYGVAWASRYRQLWLETEASLQVIYDAAAEERREITCRHDVSNNTALLAADASPRRRRGASQSASSRRSFVSRDIVVPPQEPLVVHGYSGVDVACQAELYDPNAATATALVREPSRLLKARKLELFVLERARLAAKDASALFTTLRRGLRDAMAAARDDGLDEIPYDELCQLVGEMRDASAAWGATYQDVTSANSVITHDSIAATQVEDDAASS